MAAGIPSGFTSRAQWQKSKFPELANSVPVAGEVAVDTTIGGFQPVLFEKEQKPMQFGGARVSLDDVARANEEFSNDGLAADYWKGTYKKKREEYETLWNQFNDAGDEANKIALNNQYQAILNKRKEYNMDYSCTLDGQCPEGSKDLLNDLSESWTLNDLKSNRPLLESIQRTNGAYNNDGKLKTKTELIDEFIRDQQFIEYNLTAKGMKAVELAGFDEQEKTDLALQWISFQKTYGTESDGGISTQANVENIGGAILSDPVNVVGGVLVRGVFRGAMKAFGKNVGKDVTKLGVKSWLKTRAGGSGAGWGSSFMAADSLSDQNILIQADLQTDINWGRVGFDTAMGAATGFGIGFGLVGTAQLTGGTVRALKNNAERYRIQQNLSDQEFIEQTALAVTTKDGAKTFLKAIGWDKESLAVEMKKIKKLEKEGFKNLQDVYDVPTVVRNSEESIFASKLNQEEFAQIPQGLPTGATLTEKTIALAKEPLIKVAKNNAQAQKNIDILEAKKLVDDEAAMFDSLAEDMVTVPNTVIPAYNQWGYNTFKFLNDTFKDGFTNTLYKDMKLVYSGARGLAESMQGANMSIDINLSRINGKIKEFITRNEDKLGDVNKILGEGIGSKNLNKEQKQLVNEILRNKKIVLTDLRKAGVLNKTEYKNFMKDDSYVPRVWNHAYLSSTPGSEAFHAYLTAMHKVAPEDAAKIISNIIGDEKYTQQVLTQLRKGSWTKKDVKSLWNFNAMEAGDVKRSSHVEKKRKLDIPAKLERTLDPYMAKPVDRWAMFFSDTVKRSEYAKRFGANDEKVVDFIKKMKKEAKKEKDPLKAATKDRAANDVSEIYFTTVGDRSKSAVINETMEQAVIAKYVSKVNAFQNWKLGLAWIPNGTQAFVNGSTMAVKNATAGEMLMMPAKAVGALVRGVVKTKQDMRDVHGAGVLGDMEIAKISTENAANARILDYQFGGKDPLSFIAKTLNEPTLFLRRTGFLSVEEWNRRSGAIFGFGHIKSVHTKYKKLVADGKINSNKALKLKKELRVFGVLDPLKKELTADELSIAANIFNKKINFSGESAELPINWSKPWWKLATKFKSFMFYQARFLKREVADELFIHGNAKPLFMYLAAAGIAGEGIEQLKSTITGKDIKDNRNAFEILINGIGNSGAFGLYFDTLMSLSERGGGGLLLDIAGPSVGDFLNTGSDLLGGDIDRIVSRLTPNIPGKSLLENTWRDQ